MSTDVLGRPFLRETITLAPDEEGEVVATLVSRAGPKNAKRAVLYVHGFVDYFFQTELADRYVTAGFAFYALDLRKYGRSLRDHQTPNFCVDMREYFAELDAAVQRIRERDGFDVLVLNGHSTGGLLLSLYAHHRRERGTIQALFLNSPFFELNEGWLERRLLAPVASSVASLKPYAVLSQGLGRAYGESLHRAYHGEWEYDRNWKPVEGFPVRAGWLKAITAAQKELHSGLAIACPVLVMHSSESIAGDTWSEPWMRADGVLNVEDISRYSNCLGDHLTRIRIRGGMHDLALSAPSVREVAYEQLERWLRAYVPDDTPR